MDMPKVGEYFINGEGHLCKMIEKDMYYDYSYPHIISLHYITYNVIFSKMRDATKEEIETKLVMR